MSDNKGDFVCNDEEYKIIKFQQLKTNINVDKIYEDILRIDPKKLNNSLETNNDDCRYNNVGYFDNLNDTSDFYDAGYSVAANGPNKKERRKY